MRSRALVILGMFVLGVASIGVPGAQADALGGQPCEVDLKDGLSGYVEIRTGCVGYDSCAVDYSASEVDATAGCVCSSSCTIEALSNPIVIRPDHPVPDTVPLP